MASNSVKTLGVFQKTGILDKGIAALLPEAYKKFYKEWRLMEPTAVHYIPETGKWKRNEVTGEVLPIQNIPIPVFYPKESNDHLWGGEGVVQGFQKRNRRGRRVPHFWVPILKRSVVYSKVLDKFISVVITDRAIQLIHAHYGFDHYLLKSPACDLQSLMALSIKRKILQELTKGCPTYSDRPQKQKEVLDQYKGYLAAYTPEEIEWYGYSLSEACIILKTRMEIEEKSNIVPLKHVYRADLMEKLRAGAFNENNELKYMEGKNSTWLQKINPFGRKHET